MTRKFVDYGIDLGTTNSCIAVYEEGEAKIIKNDEDDDYTPSAVYFDEDGTKFVGRVAKESEDKDPENAESEFKLQMGTEWKGHFARSGRWMTPQELSAQVLMSLKENCLRRSREEISAAVISVPAAFTMAKSAATEAAARLAGIQFSPLVQEPVAAAWAYGFQREARKAFWLVYDLGGGTFDAAIVKSHDGMVQIEDNGGDEYLGGKLIDWDIVEQLLIPEVKSKAGLADFERGNPRWIGAIARLKREAEEAKISLSLKHVPSFKIETILKSGDGTLVPFEYRLKKEQVEQLAEPYIRKTISICKKILSDVGLHPGDIEKVLLVGGPTRMPYLMERLADAEEGLGIPLEFGFDPMTVVAKGAAIFAATFEHPGGGREPPPPPPPGFTIDLYKYKQFGSDPEPLVVGKVIAPSAEADFTGYYIEFISSGAPLPWMSGKVPIGAEGKFSANLYAQAKKNIFLIELTDPQGAKFEVEPIFYTLGPDGIGAPLTHSIGVALADNKVDWFFKKGAELPQRSRPHELTSAIFFSKEKEGVALRIPIIVGEHERADRNELIGHIEATAQHIKRDIHIGDDVEVELEINESRVLSVRVLTAALHEEINANLDLLPKRPNTDQLGEQVQHALARLEGVKEMAVETGDLKSLTLLNELDKDGIIQEVAKKQKDAATDPASRDELEKRLRELNVRIDDVEKAVEIPWLMLQAQRAMATAQGFVERRGTELHKQTFPILQRELLSAMRARVIDPNELRRKIVFMYQFTRHVWESADMLGYWTCEFEEVKKTPVSDFTNPDLARELIVQGGKAIYSNEIEKLATSVRQLWQLLPDTQPLVPVPLPSGGWDSTVKPKDKNK